MSGNAGPRGGMDEEADSLDGLLPAAAPPARQVPEPSLPRAYRWQATMDLTPGVVIARPVVGITGSRATMHLAVGSMITADTLAQLINKGVECVAVRDDHPPDAETYAALVARHQARLCEIFEASPDPSCRPLFDALMENGPL